MQRMGSSVNSIVVANHPLHELKIIGADCLQRLYERFLDAATECQRVGHEPIKLFLKKLAAHPYLGFLGQDWVSGRSVMCCDQKAVA